MGDIEVYDSFTDLELSNNNHKLKVKILKTWRRPVFNDPKHTYSLEFVCADEQGNRAQGSCLALFFYRFERFLEEQNVLTIKKPLLGSNRGSWTVINSPLKICFNSESQLALSPQWSGSRHSFSFTDFKTIIDCQASLKCSIDIIGMLIDCSPIKKMKNDVETSWVLIQLQDLSGEKIWVTMFDEYAYKITEFLLANPGLGHYCVVLQFARFKIFEAGTTRHLVSNAFSNSNLFINDSDIEEITTFLDRFIETEDGQSSSTYKSGSLSVMISKEEDFLDVTDFMYSAQVADITEIVVVLGTIKKVNNQWFYMACNHYLRKVKSQLEPLKVTEGEPGSPMEVVTYYCKNPACNDTKKVIQAYPRYMVLLKVQDSTGTVDRTLFDSEAKKIIKKTALEVHDNYTPDPKLKEDVLAINVPDEIASFIDKRYAFKIGVTDNHINKRFKSYTIKALTDDVVIITALDEKYFKHELGTDDSDFLSSQNTSEKEVISICDDNVTPSSISNIAKLNADERESKHLKRNLDDSFENQELLTMSSAKKQSSSSNSELSSKGEFDGIVDGKLLIPKKEKMENGDNCKQKRKDRKEILDAKRRKPMYRSNDQLHKSTAIYNTLHSGPRLLPQLQEIHNKDMCSASTVTFRSPLIDVSNVVSPTIASGKENNGKPVRRPTILIADNINSSSSTSSSRSSQFRNTSSYNNLSALSGMSSISTLSSGRHTLKPKTFNNTPVPMMDITSDGFGGFMQPTRDTTVGISKDYLDHGDQVLICEVCKAKLWKQEGLLGRHTKIGRCYSLCCGYGKVQLPHLKEPTESYKELFSCANQKSKYFLKKIRRYNSMFSFTSMGGKVDKSINKGGAPFVFKLSGQNYHTIGTLLPKDGEPPRFSQLYIYDTENEVSNRQQAFESKSASVGIEVQIIQQLKDMLDKDNVLVKSYRMARDHLAQNPNCNVKLRIISNRNKDARTYNLPTTSEVAALIVGDVSNLLDHRDIVVTSKSGSLQRISELHPSYLPLQYPLLFPNGDDGYTINIPHRDVTIDAYTMVESERLNFIRGKQSSLRSETLEAIKNAKNQGQKDMSSIGQRVVLPSSFTGGARFMMQNFLDAMALCKWYGYPDLFITITCNPRWPEIIRFLLDKTIKPEDRPDILCRLFKMKLDSLIKDIKEKSLFGKIQAVVYTIEFQKHGLPHAHICLFMHPDSKLPTPDHIDHVISAEIPDHNEDPELYSLVQDFMIHGPCGHHNTKSPCMVKDKCSKNFPKKFRERTSTDSDGFPLYRRRRDGPTIVKSGADIDTRFVVPYNKFLLKKYQAHINVEWCNQGNAIKYLFKYINKGPDRTTLKLQPYDSNGQPLKSIDEIKLYYDCRYVSACEASWRIYAFDVHHRYPSVTRLPFHLPGQQNVIFGEEDNIDDVLEKASISSSMFESWMKCNELYPHARNLTYVQFPSKFVWHAKDRCWKPRKQGVSVGRIHSVSPALGEAYFLRVLLNKVKGPTSFEDIRTVNGHQHASFRDACYALGLLDDDNEYIEAIKEASHHGTGHFLRNLFATMLVCSALSRPDHVWHQSWKTLSDGIVYQRQHNPNTEGSSINDDELKNLTLLEIEKILVLNNSSLNNFDSMPYPQCGDLLLSENALINEERSYDKDVMLQDFENLFVKLTEEQRNIYDEIITSIDNKEGGVFFIYGYGGTGKTFLWNTLSASIRSQGKIVLNVASSGIASLLLPGGRTARSRFRIPINITEDSICRLKPDSDSAKLLKETSLIIWDEAPMTNKHCFEALDKSLNDLLGNKNSSGNQSYFGGKVVVFGGDFRQILPVVPGGTDEDIVNSSLSSSYIWSQCKDLKLTRNVRLTTGDHSNDLQSIQEFADWLLQLGEGLLGGDNDGHAERAILAPTNEIVHEINNNLLSIIPGEEKEYLSSDSICQSDDGELNDDTHIYSPDFLNGLQFSGLPSHKLLLKIGAPVMLLRNLDKKNGLCNGTRLQIVALGKRILEAEVISGSNIGYRTFIPRISMSPSDKKNPFKFNRRQFPIAVCLAMTVNKSQGQSLSRVGLYLKNPCFSHRQLYVALSTVKSKDGLKLLILDEDGKVTNKTLNVVYKSVFSNL
ncbi:hypothetical protein SSX86_030995 [Deinandra increscens subsp. villosa]|uniref:ATP-dependent DNA helicase n=1 Tax=Deinandra increscens subsp. villosa TaxID=3103831 RepID=A0AAP0C4Z3_9ASTR